MRKENRRCVPLITSLLDASAAAPRSSCSALRPSSRIRHWPPVPRPPSVLLARDRPLEAPEDALGVLGGDTDAPVRHGQARARGVRTDTDGDLRPRTVLEGVRQQVRDHLVQPGAIPPSNDMVLGVDLQPALCTCDLLAEALHHIMHEGGKIDLFQLELQPPLAEA